MKSPIPSKMFEDLSDFSRIQIILLRLAFEWVRRLMTLFIGFSVFFLVILLLLVSGCFFVVFVVGILQTKKKKKTWKPHTEFQIHLKFVKLHCCGEYLSCFFFFVGLRFFLFVMCIKEKIKNFKCFKCFKTEMCTASAPTKFISNAHKINMIKLWSKTTKSSQSTENTIDGKPKPKIIFKKTHTHTQIATTINVTGSVSPLI